MFLLQNIDSIGYLNVAVHHCQAPKIIIIFRYWGYNVNYVVTSNHDALWQNKQEQDTTFPHTFWLPHNNSN